MGLTIIKMMSTLEAKLNLAIIDAMRQLDEIEDGHNEQERMEFERKLAEYLEVPYATRVSNMMQILQDKRRVSRPHLEDSVSRIIDDTWLQRRWVFGTIQQSELRSQILERIQTSFTTLDMHVIASYCEVLETELTDEKVEASAREQYDAKVKSFRETPRLLQEKLTLAKLNFKRDLALEISKATKEDIDDFLLEQQTVMIEDLIETSRQARNEATTIWNGMCFQCAFFNPTLAAFIHIHQVVNVP